MHKTAFIISTMLILAFLAVSAAASTPLPAPRHIYINVSNDAGVKWDWDSVYYGPPGSVANDTYYIKADGGGLNELHVTNDVDAAYGQVSTGNDLSGVLYFTNTGGRGYDNDIIILVSVRGPVPDDFALHVRSSGYNWTPAPPGAYTPTELPSDYYHIDGAIDETFTKSDFLYGPQTWKPGPGDLVVPSLSLYSGQDINDASTEEYLMFIDLYVGNMLPSKFGTTLVDNGAAKVEYTFTNLTTRAEFNGYGWCSAANQNQSISWTNKLTDPGASGYSVVRTEFPTITGITPNFGPNTTSISITNLAGMNFNTTSPPSVMLNGTGFPDIVATDVSTVSSSRITCTFDLTGQPAGARNVVVTNPGGQVGMLENGFIVKAPIPAPTVSGIVPGTGVNTGAIHITNLSGTNFDICPFSSPLVKLNGTGFADIVATDVSTISSTQITCTFDLAGQPSGARNVVVTNPDGNTGILADAFAITAPAPTSRIGLFRPSIATWFLDHDNNGWSDYRISWGTNGDLPVTGDWDNDGRDEIGLWRPSTATWYLDYDNNGASDFRISWGSPGDWPVTGDWDNDGRDEIGLWRPSTARWYLDYDNNGLSNYQVTWGASSDIPVTGDWDNDGYDEIGLWRPSTARWYLDHDNNGLSNFQVSWGASTDKPVTGDWDSDGYDEIGLFRPSIARWYLDYDNNGLSNFQVAWGAGSDRPVIGAWT